MKSNKLMKFLALMFLMTGCATPTTTALPPNTTQIPTMITKLINATPSPNSTLTATSTSSQTPTKLPTLTTTITSSFTPNPTLSADEARKLILELVQIHEGCQLPCLWGFTPGTNELRAAREFVRQFGIGDVRIDDIQIGAHTYNDGGTVGISYLKNKTYVVIHWSYNQSGKESQLGLLTMDARPMKSLGLDPINQLPIMSPVFGDPTFSQELREYLLPSILTTYGLPAQVLLTVRTDEPDNTNIVWHPFSLAIVYPEQGIFVEYVSSRETIGKNYVGCPDQSYINLVVWNPKNGINLEYLVEKAGSEIMLSILKPIDKATTMTVDEFYQIFRNPENTSCLETPIELWNGTH